MAKGHRSQIKRARNENNKETRPSAKLSYARISVQKACYVLDAIRGKDVQTALGILTYNPRYASSVLKKLLESAIANAENNNGMSADNISGIENEISFGIIGPLHISISYLFFFNFPLLFPFRILIPENQITLPDFPDNKIPYILPVLHSHKFQEGFHLPGNAPEDYTAFFL